MNVFNRATIVATRWKLPVAPQKDGEYRFSLQSSVCLLTESLAYSLIRDLRVDLSIHPHQGGTVIDILIRMES